MNKQMTPGLRFGRWTVQDDFVLTDKGEKKWLCLCDCGTKRYVLERSLLYGGSQSCGCLRKENAQHVNSHDLTGQVFGELTVLQKAEYQRKNGGIWWLCKCSCGAEYEVPGTLLMTGRRTHCGSKIHSRNYATTDITGRRFNRLTALYPTEQRDDKGSVIWHCRCDCGNELNVSYNNLVYCNMKSCGCQKKEHDQSLKELLTHVDGTSLDMIRSKKIPKDNTTGYKGVYFVRGRYMAKIVFQKKAYYLGTYRRIEDAVDVRQEAEALLFDETAAFYEQWNRKAERDPEWAKANPIKIRVFRASDGRLAVNYQPALEVADTKPGEANRTSVEKKEIVSWQEKTELVR
jgi:hypothetical protein